jgi:hypothetical protein
MAEASETQYVQAWECTGPLFSGYVYDQAIALDKMALGCDIESVTIVRHPNGAREYLRGTVASYVQKYREAQEGK